MHERRMRRTGAEDSRLHDAGHQRWEAKLRAETRRPKQPVTWIPQVLDLFKLKGHVTSRELAAVLGKSMGGDAVTRCRQVGLPVEAVGLAEGSDRQKLYALDASFLWLALEEAVQQINRYALLLNSGDRSAQYPRFRTMAIWIEHVRGIEKARSKPRGRQKPS